MLHSFGQQFVPDVSYMYTKPELYISSTTNNDGRAGFLEGSDQWGAGVYRLHFETETYFNSQNIAGFYPFVEVSTRYVCKCYC